MLMDQQEGRFDTERAVVDYGERINAAEGLLDSYLSSGILGLIFGLGNSASFSPRVVGFYTHIVPIEILCELGLIGFSMLMAILALTVRALVRLGATMSAFQKSADTRRVIASLAALALIELVLAFKEGSLVRDVNLFLFPVVIEGIAASVGRCRPEASKSAAPAKRATLGRGAELESRLRKAEEHSAY
jgi:hypothetical protein